MKLKPIISNKNNYPIGGLLIKGKTAIEWATEINRIGLNIHQYNAYAIPSEQPNVLYGCIIFGNFDKIKEGNYALLQLINQKLFIPEYCDISPKLTDSDWPVLFKEDFYLLHPIVGFCELQHPIDWSELFITTNEISAETITPIKARSFSENITSITLEIPENEIIDSLVNSIQANEDDDISNLPFNLKKIFNGNQKEIDKLMEYLKKNPDAALKYALPLDLIGTTRGKEWAKFNFKNKNPFANLFQKKSSNAISRSTKKTSKYFKISVITIFTILALIFLYLFVSNEPVNTTEAKYSNETNVWSKFLMILLFFVICTVLILFIVAKLFKSENSSYKKANNSNLSQFNSVNTENFHINKKPTKTDFLFNNENWENFMEEKKSKTFNLSFRVSALSLRSKILVGLTHLVALYSILSFSAVLSQSLIYTLITILLIIRIYYLFFKGSTEKPKDDEEFHTTAIINLFLVKLIMIIIAKFTVFSLVMFIFSLLGNFFLFSILCFIIIRNFKPENRSGLGGSGSVITSSSKLSSLEALYQNLAKEYIEKKEYKKAAYIYFRLLKNNWQAAETLANGGLYAQAAMIYLKNCNNKIKAAECYEKARMTNKAIELYLELKEYEKVGDLYLQLNNKTMAYKNYQVKVDEYVANAQYISAATILKIKMLNHQAANEILLKGWVENKDAINCLNFYFSGLENPSTVESEIIKIYGDLVNKNNYSNYLTVLKHQYKRDVHLENTIENLAYQIIGKYAQKNPSMLTHLLNFTKNNKKLIDDVGIFRFRKNLLQ